MRKVLDPALVAEWFGLVREWDLAERKLPGLTGPDEIAALKTRMAEIKARMDDVIRAGRDERDTASDELIIGTIRIGGEFEDAPAAADRDDAGAAQPGPSPVRKSN